MITARRRTMRAALPTVAAVGWTYAPPKIDGNPLTAADLRRALRDWPEDRRQGFAGDLVPLDHLLVELVAAGFAPPASMADVGRLCIGLDRVRGTHTTDWILLRIPRDP